MADEVLTKPTTQLDLEARGTSEAKVEKELLAAMKAREENSKQAQGGATTYAASVEVDPLGRTAGIVRGGPGDNAPESKSEKPSAPRAGTPAKE